MRGPVRAVRGHRLVLLLSATALCYLIGYPLALVWHSNIGWALVFLGGPLLIGSGAAIIRVVTSKPGDRDTPPQG